MLDWEESSSFQSPAGKGISIVCSSCLKLTTIKACEPSKSLAPEQLKGLIQGVLDTESDVLTRFQRLIRNRIDSFRIRIHGDYHLGQVLFTGNDFIVIDFEGEPLQSINNRRLKHSPLKDVAGMMR